jgi:predicted metal-dependent HD superfamily phosphohydrolase
MKTEYKPHTSRLKKVDQYIRKLFRDELPESIQYHDAEHTLHPTKGVVAVANNLAILENISEHDRELLIAAAYFHDVGFIREYVKNEAIAARMAGRVLELIGYNSNEVENIQSMILATDPEVEPRTHVEKILCDADLDNLGREDFFEMDDKLREGQRLKGKEVSDNLAWRRRTIDFMKKHKYYTEFQRKFREEGKSKNLKKLLEILKSLET